MTSTNAYPFDPTGVSTANKITGEQQILTKVNYRDFQFIIPKQAPFFKSGLNISFTDKITGVTRTLVEGQDYVLTHEFLAATRSCAKPIYGSISFIDTNLEGVVTLNTYQTIGGVWTISTDDINQLLSTATANPRSTSWDAIVDLPATFPVVDHQWDLVDMVGLSEVVAQLVNIYEALLLKSGNAQLATYTISQINDLLAKKLDTSAQAISAKTADAINGLDLTELMAYILAGTAANASKFNNMTYDQVIASISATVASNATTLSGKTLDDILNSTVANSTKLGGMTLAQVLSAVQAQAQTVGESNATQVEFGALSALAGYSYRWSYIGMIDLAANAVADSAAGLITTVAKDRTHQPATFLIDLAYNVTGGSSPYDLNVLNLTRDDSGVKFGYVISKDNGKDAYLSLYVRTATDRSKIVSTALSKALSLIAADNNYTDEPGGIVYADEKTFAYSSELASANSAINQSKSDISDIEGTLLTHWSHITSLETSRTSDETNIANLQSGLASANSNISKNTDNISSLSSTLTALQNTVSSNKSAADSSISSLQSDVSSLKSSRTTDESNISSLQSSVGTINSTLTTMQSTDSSLQTQINSLSTSVSSNSTSTNTTISGIQSDISSLKTSRTTDESNISTLQTNVSSLQTSVGNINSSISTIQSKQSTDETNIGNLQTSVSNLNTSLGATNTNIGTLSSLTTSSKDSIVNAINSLKSALDTTNSTQSSLSSTVGTNSSNISSLTTRMGTAESNISSLSSSLGNYQPKASLLTALAGISASTAGNVRANGSGGFTIDQTSYQGADADLSAIAGLSDSATGFLKKTGANSWSLDNSSYLTGITSSMVTSALGYTPLSGINSSMVTSALGFTPISGISSAMVTNALGYTPLSGLDADLNAIAALSDSATGLLRKTAANTWSLDSTSYLTGISSAMVVSALGFTPISGISSAMVTSVLDADLNAIASLPDNGVGFLRKNGFNTWELDTNAYLTSISKSMVVSALGYTPLNGLPSGLQRLADLSANGAAVGLLRKSGVDSWFMDTAAYLTSITSDMVTSALGYTPLSTGGGTINGDLLVTGTITANTDIVLSSDETRKKDWDEVDSGLVSRLANVLAGSYTRIGQEGRFVGVGAQHLQSVIPEAVVTTEDGSLAVSYGPAAMMSVVALAKRAVVQEVKIADMESRIEALEALVLKLTQA